VKRQGDTQWGPAGPAGDGHSHEHGPAGPEDRRDG